MREQDVKGFYAGYRDEIRDKRFHSPFWLRRFAHHAIYERTVRRVGAGQLVLDAGCGDGVLSGLMADRGAHVVGVDLSLANVRAARDRVGSVSFAVGDLERLPIRDRAFEVAVSSHVIEHLPHPDRGLEELCRVTRGQALIAMPTCLSPGAWGPWLAATRIGGCHAGRRSLSCAGSAGPW